jgi:glutamate racemase
MIGIFDSGLGGLTALREAVRLMPNEDFIYFGDTGRVPYGTRSRDTIIQYAKQAMRFFASHNVEAVLAACGTVSSVALDELKASFDLPIIGVVEGAAKSAIEKTKNKKIGIIGTSATVRSASFEKVLKGLSPDVQTMGVACPLFVPLVENGYVQSDDCVTLEVARRYLQPIKDFGADTLILGCAHFPIIAEVISRVLPSVTLINSGSEAAKQLLGLKGDGVGGGSVRYYVSDSPENFSSVASIFLGEDFIGGVEKIEIQNY